MTQREPVILAPGAQPDQFAATPASWLAPHQQHGPVMRIPAGRLYWAVITGISRTGSHSALRFAFEAFLPVPIDDIEARFLPLGDAAQAKVVACGVDRAQLAAWIEEAERSLCGEPGRDKAAVHSVHPSLLPDCVLRELNANHAMLDHTGSESLCRQLEFRTGVFESPTRRTHRRRTIAAALATSAAACALGSAALLLDADRLDRHASATRTAGDALITASLGPRAVSPPGKPAPDPSLRLAAELRRMEQTRDQAAVRILAEDRLPTFVQLLAAWPESVPTRVESLGLEQDAITVRGFVRDALDYEKLSAALKQFIAVGAGVGNAGGCGGGGWSEPSGSASLAGPGSGYAFNLVSRRLALPSPSQGAAGSPAPRSGM